MTLWGFAIVFGVGFLAAALEDLRQEWFGLLLGLAFLGLGGWGAYMEYCPQ